MRIGRTLFEVATRWARGESRSILVDPCRPNNRHANRSATRTARAVTALHRVLGVPDYDAYLDHVRRQHPDRPPIPRAAFVRDALARRYERPGNRCC